MSSTAAFPPPTPPTAAPQGPSFLRNTPLLSEKTRELMTELNLHLAGVAVLAVLVLYLAVHMVYVWQSLSANNADAIAEQRVQLRAAQLAAQPLRGLDSKLESADQAANDFYVKRLPYAISQVASELGTLAKREGVRQMRTQYAYAPVLSGSDALTEVRMDASISGDYRPVVQFINAAERDKMFFVINGINLTGQQTGQVNLRVRLTTYLRSPQGDEMKSDVALPTDTDEGGAK
jgi:type IV pilus assembly protein PilO